MGGVAQGHHAVQLFVFRKAQQFGQPGPVDGPHDAAAHPLGPGGQGQVGQRDAGVGVLVAGDGGILDHGHEQDGLFTGLRHTLLGGQVGRPFDQRLDFGHHRGALDHHQADGLPVGPAGGQAHRLHHVGHDTGGHRLLQKAAVGAAAGEQFHDIHSAFSFRFTQQVGQAADGPPAPAGDGLGVQQRGEDALLHAFGRGPEKQVDPVLVDGLQGYNVPLRVVGDAVPGGKGDDDLPAAVAAVGAGAAQAHDGPAGHPAQLAAGEGSVGGQHRDDGPPVLVGRDAGGQPLPDGDARQDQIVKAGVVGQDQRPQMVGTAVQFQPAGGRPDAPFQPVAAHPAAGPHRALGKAGAAAGQGCPDVLPGDVEAPDVVKAAVVALAHHRVDAAGGLADVGAQRQHMAHQGVVHRAHAQGVGEQDGRLQSAQLLDLDKAGGLAKAVDDVGRRRHFFVKEIAGVGQKGGDAGLHLPVGEGAVAHRHPRHVADEVAGSVGQAAHGKAPACFNAHKNIPPGKLLRRGVVQSVQVVGGVLVDVVVQPVGIEQVGVGPPAKDRRLGRVVAGVVVFRGRDGQPPGHVPAVFGVQGQLVVLGVPGDEDLPAVLGAQQVGARLIAGGQDAQGRAPGDVLRAHAGVAAVGGVEHLVKAADQRVRRPGDPVGEDAEHLGGQQLLAHPIVVVQPRLRPPADVEGGVDVGLGVVHDLAQLVPVVHLLEGDGLHRRASDDHAVETAVPHLVEGLVKGFEVGGGDVGGRVAGRLQQGHVHLQRAVGQQPGDLRLGGDLGGHQVEDGDLQRPDVLGQGPLPVHDEDVLRIQRIVGGQGLGDDEGHGRFLSEPSQSAALTAPP